MSLPKPDFSNPVHTCEERPPIAGGLEHRFAEFVARRYPAYVGRWSLAWEGVSGGTVRSFTVGDHEGRLYIMVVLK